MTENNTAPKFYFTLVVGRVTFTTEDGPMAADTQIITKSPNNLFPADRLSQLQNSMALSVRNTLQEVKQFTAHDTLFLAMHPLGYMTEAEMFGRGVTAEVKLDTVDASSAVETTNNGDNVVQFPKD